MTDETERLWRDRERAAFLKEHAACRDALDRIPIFDATGNLAKRQIRESVKAMLFVRMGSVLEIADAVHASAEYWDGKRLWSPGNPPEERPGYEGRDVGWYPLNFGSGGGYSDFSETDPRDRPRAWESMLEAVLESALTCQVFVKGAMKPGEELGTEVEILPDE